MIMRNSDFLSGKFKPAGKESACPECGGPMTEVDRRNENQALFVWLNCRNNDCDGQWLRKIPPRGLKSVASGGYQG